MTVEIGFFGEHRCRLGESPVWDGRGARLWWVDAMVGEIHAADADGTPLSCWRYDQPVGSIGLADGGLVAAMADGFYRIDGETGAATALHRIPTGEAALRFNDGKADRGGRFLSGQMHMGDDSEPAASLWRLDADGRATAVVDGIRLTNATCFSPDGAALYVADSLEGIVRAYPYDGGTGTLGERRDLVDTRVHGSAPDGATVDREGRLWIALVLAQKLACFAPDGALLRTIDVPIPYPSCPAFGGADMTTLYVTSIADSGHRLVTDHPDGGRILAITGLGATGIAEGRYGGDNHIRE